MRPRRGKNNQTVPLYEECALWDSLLNAPFLWRISWESSAHRQGAQFYRLSTPAQIYDPACMQEWWVQYAGGVGGNEWWHCLSRSEREMTTRREQKKRVESIFPLKLCIEKADVGQGENDLLGVCLEVSVAEGTPTLKGKNQEQPLNCRDDGSDLQWLYLSNELFSILPLNYNLHLMWIGQDHLF